jgi:hypothetical protein
MFSDGVEKDLTVRSGVSLGEGDAVVFGAAEVTVDEVRW